jgi:hypothetical protein
MEKRREVRMGPLAGRSSGGAAVQAGLTMRLRRERKERRIHEEIIVGGGYYLYLFAGCGYGLRI